MYFSSISPFLLTPIMTYVSLSHSFSIFWGQKFGYLMMELYTGILKSSSTAKGVC